MDSIQGSQIPEDLASAIVASFSFLLRTSSRCPSRRSFVLGDLSDIMAFVVTFAMNSAQESCLPLTQVWCSILYFLFRTASISMRPSFLKGLPTISLFCLVLNRLISTCMCPAFLVISTVPTSAAFCCIPVGVRFEFSLYQHHQVTRVAYWVTEYLERLRQGRC